MCTNKMTFQPFSGIISAKVKFISANHYQLLCFGCLEYEINYFTFCTNYLSVPENYRKER